MKSDVMHSRAIVEPMILNQLVREVKETVATDVEFRAERPRSFGVVNLWNIRRNSRYAAHPRKKPTIVNGLRG
ncbi:MAG TPA: hypothetical protein VGM30_05785 [Puia sp.]